MKVAIVVSVVMAGLLKMPQEARTIGGDHDLRMQEGQSPPEVKIDIKKAIEIVEKEFKSEEKIFLQKVELKFEKATGGGTWRWVVALQTLHAGHWGPGGCSIDAMTGKVVEDSRHDHK